MRRRFPGILLSLLALVCGHAISAVQSPSPSPSYLANIGPAPDSDLVEGDHSFSLARLRGRPVLVSFVYTTCTGTCPATTANLVHARRVLTKEGLDVPFVSITLDPAHDTPEVLDRYARNYGIDRASWHFLAGDPDAVARVHAAWGMWTKRDAKGALDHPSRIFLVDALGRIREIYNLEVFDARTLVQDVRSLKAETGGSAERSEGRP